MYTSLGILAVTLIVFVSWRFASRRQSLPCPSWLRWMVELDNPFTATNRSAVIVEHLGLEPGMLVLDMGCGPGRLAIPVALKVGDRGRVVAVDIQAAMLRRAEKKAAQAGVDNIEFIQADAGKNVLGKPVFDRALLIAVLGEIPDRENVFRQIYAALKPGGVLSVTEIIFDPHFQRQTTVRNLARQTGFREKAVFGNSVAYTMHLEKPAPDRAD
jgi:ubiquinone/menaquinone biosynthesis C-methylase UbiE